MENKLELSQAMQALVRIRREAEITQVEISRRMGISQPEISRMERLEAVSSERITRYAKALGLRVMVTFERA